MANIKEIRIQYRLPYNWLMDDLIDASEVAAIASLVLSPAGGVTLENRRDGYDKNKNGGATAMYLVTIVGREGCSYQFLNRVAGALERAAEVASTTGVDAERIVAEACDVQWEDENNPWEHLRPEYYPDRQKDEVA